MVSPLKESGTSQVHSLRDPFGSIGVVRGACVRVPWW